MRILGVNRKNGTSTGTTYIAEINHVELEKFLNLYYGNLSLLAAGDEVDLGKGHTYHRDTMDALQKMEGLISSNQKVIEGLLSGFTIVSKIAAAAVVEEEDIHVDH